MGSSGSIVGTVTDPSGAVIAGATVSLENPVSHYHNQATTDAGGTYKFNNIPFSHYHLSVAASGFQAASQDLDVRSTVPVTQNFKLQLGVSESSVTVSADAGDLVENVPTAHTDVDEKQFSQLPITSPASGLSDIITMSAPGVVADSNGMFHPLGEHSDTTYMVDNQPVTDQQSKQFSTQLPENAIQSLEIIEGQPLAEYGDKTGLIVNTVTKSGLGQKPFGSFSTYAGSFATYGEDATLGFGSQKAGNFLAANSSRSGRFLDSPEFAPNHDVGNSMQIFDRLDYQPDENDTLHLNLGMARNWFQIANTYDQAMAGQDQRQRVLSWNVAPGYVHMFGSTVVLTISPWFRQDQVSYYPSRDLLADQPITIGQSRRLGSTGVKADVSYVHGIHNLKIGGQLSHSLLRESFELGITDPTFNPPCLTSSGSAYVGMASCNSAGLVPNPDFLPGLFPYDLTRGGQQFAFLGRTDVKEYSGYIQDQIKLRGWTLSLGLRGDVYRGLSEGSAVQPRIGVSYQFKPTATVLRIYYARTFETPYNENLVLSSATGTGGLGNVFGASSEAPLQPGKRDEYGAGLQQAAGKHLVISADYTWKYTHNAFDFDTLLNTPITFPISWRKSKIDGVAARLSVPEIHGFSAFTTLGHTRARFFGPEQGGLIFNSSIANSVFRIDHDQAFQQTTYLRYQFGKHGPWTAFTWRYDSGEVAGSITDIQDVLALSGDEQQQIGVSCGGSYPTLLTPIRACGPGQLNVARLRIPGNYNADVNPTRVAARNLFDAAIGWDDIAGKPEGRHWTGKITLTNLTNVAALYNFLSTFSGTHWVQPRTWQAEIGYVF